MNNLFPLIVRDKIIKDKNEIFGANEHRKDQVNKSRITPDFKLSFV